VFNGVFLKLGSVVINEAAIGVIELDRSDKVRVHLRLTTEAEWTSIDFTGREADQLRRLYNSDPEIWAQREGPGWCGVLDLTPEAAP
jgi:hypothetical protein